MNWMGGARNRIKFQGERKIQEDFFERQKLNAARALSSRTPGKKKGISQDLVALHTVSRVHSHTPTVFGKPKQIKKVDLERFRSCTRQIDEIDIGPCSPTETPSKLILREGKHDRESHCPGNSSTRKDFTEFNRPTLRFVTGESKKIEQSVEKQFSKPDENMLNNSHKIGHMDINPVQKEEDFLFSKPKPVSEYEKGSGKVKLGFDPFASEDFQITPLVRYSKKKYVEHNDGGGHHKKRRHSGEKEARLEHIPSKKLHRSEKLKFTSTPVAETYTKNELVKDSDNFGGISPIFKGTSFSKEVDAGFKFKPRPMLVTPDNHIGKRETFKYHPHDVSALDNTKMNRNSHWVETKFKLGTENDNFLNYIGFNTSSNERFTKESLSPCYKPQTESSNSGIETTTSCSMNYSSHDISPSSVAGDDTIVMTEPVGSLSKSKSSIRNRDVRNSGLGKDEAIHLENAVGNKIGKEAEIPIPKFVDIEEDFHYTPMKQMKSNVGASSDIIDMYQKIKNEKAIHKGLEEEQVIFNTKREQTRLSGGSVQISASPIPADEFPQHLLSPSEQLQNEIDRKLSQFSTEEIISDGSSANQQSNHQDIAIFYKPRKYHIDDVLNEMKQLEEQDTATPPDDLPDKTDTVIPLLHTGSIPTESFEADAYLETEDMLMNADIASMENMDEEKKLKSLTDDNNDMVDQTERNHSPSNTESSENKYFATKLSTLPEHDIENDLAEENKITGFDNTCIVKSGAPVLIDAKPSAISGEKEPTVHINENLEQKSSVSDTCLTGENIVNETHALKADEVFGKVQLQDPEVSSGKNQSTQTETCSSLSKTFVESSTSPMHILNHMDKLQDFGVQCELAAFPTLADLAVDCLGGKSAKKGNNSHEIDEEKVLDEHIEQLIENIGAERTPGEQQ